MSEVEDFMAKLAAQAAPMSRVREIREKKRMIEKISLNFEGNFGRYQILPLDNVVTDYPYVTLRGTREICIPRKNIAADGTENTFSTWVKIIPSSAYIMRDMTGRTVSSLTADEESLLKEAYTLFDQLFLESGAKEDMSIQRSLCRKRNYTIFHGYCINKWDFDPNKRSAARSNFSGLFISTASGFAQAVQDNIGECTVMNGGDSSFVQEIYNRKATGRGGFIMMSISRSTTAKGYTVSVRHEVSANPALTGAVIPEEDLRLMEDPLASFLGWQAKHEEDNVPATSRRLFNANLIKEAINYMTQQLAAIRMAKESGTSLEEAIKKTNDLALSTMKPVSSAVSTNDPMLAEINAANAEAENTGNPENVVVNNTDPFSTPAAAHIDPLTSSPVSNPAANSGFGVGAPFTQPSFANFGSQAGSNDLPF